MRDLWLVLCVFVLEKEKEVTAYTIQQVNAYISGYTLSVPIRLLLLNTHTHIYTQSVQ